MNYFKPPFPISLSIILYFSFLSLLSSSGQGSEGKPEYSPQNKNTRSPERIVNITALQAGSNHYKNGNPGLEANFAVFATLARKAAASKPRPDLICLPE
jgi:hypothetical protein